LTLLINSPCPYSNEPSLRKRLRDVVKLTKWLVLKLYGEKDLFVRKVVTTRNFLTHYDTSLQTEAAQGIELYHLTLTLHFLLQACFLRELGFPADTWDEMLRKNTQWHQIAQVRYAYLGKERKRTEF